jgi:hypothetical protein
MPTPKLTPRDINYLGKEFSSLRENLIEFTKTYFPKTHSDFNESSPGMLFIEMSAYVGDILSYYIDDTLKESLMVHAQDKRNVLSLAQYLGYKPKVISPAITTLSVYQLIPSIELNGDFVPDERYYLQIRQGLEVESSSNPNIRFITTERLDFGVEVDREITVFQSNTTTGDVELFLVKKKINAIAGEQVTETFEFGSPQPFQTILLNDTDVVEIQEIRDSNGNRWYEVPYLGQEMVYIDYPNTEENDDELSQFSNTVPYVLQLLKTSRRFSVKVNENNTTTIQFGVGNPETRDELIIPNIKNIGLGLNSSIDRTRDVIDPTNFLKTKTYGQSPANTTLTVKYIKGGGINTNINVGDLTRIVSIEFENDFTGLNQTEVQFISSIESSVAVENEVPGVGGRGPETLEEIRENALAFFGAQNRTVTKKDYIVRSLSMPPKFGSVAKAYAISDGSLDNNSPSSILNTPSSLEEFTNLILELRDGESVERTEIKERVKNFLVGKKNNFDEKNNPFAVNLYVLGYDSNKNLTTLNPAIKQNLKTYLNEYRMVTDGINITDGFIINIGIDYEIMVYPNYNKREVLLNTIEELKTYFNIDNWTFNMPINISEVEILIANVEGVLSVPTIEFVNKCKGIYSPNSYNIAEATKNGLIYPSVDPSIFEIKFPNRDIRGRAL